MNLHKLSYFILLLIFSCGFRQNQIYEESSSTQVLFASVTPTFRKSDTTFYDKKWKVTLRENASFFRPLDFEKEGDLWVIKDYYISGNLQSRAYSKSKDDIVWEGETIWYSEEGVVFQKRIYEAGRILYDEEAQEFRRQRAIEKYGIEVGLSDRITWESEGSLAESNGKYNAFVLQHFSDEEGESRLVIQSSAEDGNFQKYEFQFPYHYYLREANFRNGKLVLVFRDERNITDWKRTLTFRLGQYSSEDGEIAYYEEGERVFILEKEEAIAKHVPNNQELEITRTTKDFGNSLALGAFDINSDSENHTWQAVQELTNFQHLESQHDEEYAQMHAWLEQIEDNSTVNIPKGVYNFSKVGYYREGKDDKLIESDLGFLKITGYSNVKLIAEEGTYFVSNHNNRDVVFFEKCKNIELKNIYALHNVLKTYCHAPVFTVENALNMTFDNCIIDGSGLIGFNINHSDSIKILNSTIMNCSEKAIDLIWSKLRMENVKIIDNKLEDVLVLYKSNLEMKNCLIENNTIRTYHYFYFRESDVKMENCTINADVFNSVLFNSNNSRITLNSSTILLDNADSLHNGEAPVLIDCTISSKK